MAKIKIILAALSALLAVTSCTVTEKDTLTSIDTALNALIKSVANINGKINELETKIKNDKKSADSLAQQLTHDLNYAEERLRSEGQSGIKSIRNRDQGTRSYHGTQYASRNALDIHDHANHDRTLGMGEIAAVMNGVDFRTRHNDYKLVMPTSTRNYNEVVDIPFPSVPKEVTDKATVDEQIVEMREWFKAFNDQDHSVRDYRKYFKANLCYMEGAWTLVGEAMEEPFKSDLKKIDAKTWEELQDKIRFTSYGGSKNSGGNIAQLPTTIFSFNNGTAQTGQWNYRVLCHPLSTDLPTDYLRLDDSVATRLGKGIKWKDIRNKGEAQFSLNEYGTERFITYNLLDQIMYEIPGKDNYGNNLRDVAFGISRYSIEKEDPQFKNFLKAGYFSRVYKLKSGGAMSVKENKRGFHDQNLYVAKNTQTNIMGMTNKICWSATRCKIDVNRVSYAIPLEIVYTTPLQKWNPFNIEHGETSKVTQGHRNGGMQANKAFNGTSFDHYYRTPVEFYAADSPIQGTAVGVLDSKGNVKKTAPSGMTLFTPDIEGVGSVRTRYPIFATHSEGSPVGLELEALKTMLMRMPKYSQMFETRPFGGLTYRYQPAVLSVSNAYIPQLHRHEIKLSAEEYQSLVKGNSVTAYTTSDGGHQHEMELYRIKNGQIFYRKCDGKPTCWDGHPKLVVKRKTT